MTGTLLMPVLFKGFLNSPAKKVNAVGYCVARDAGFFAPLHQSHRNSIKGYPAIVCSIILLFLHRGPAAVFWSIATRIVDSINAVQGRWTWPHVFKKQNVVFPSFAYAARLISPMRKASPNPISSGFPASSAMPMLGSLYIFLYNLFGVIIFRFKACCVHILYQTATGARISKDEPGGWRGNYFPAIALTFPRAVMIRINPKAANSRQAGKFLSCQIFGVSHERL